MTYVSSHPVWCAVVEAHNREDCRRKDQTGLKTSQLTCERQTHLTEGTWSAANLSRRCGRPAKYWLGSETLCGTHARPYQPGTRARAAVGTLEAI